MHTYLSNMEDRHYSRAPPNQRPFGRRHLAGGWW
jgi:hypothetical protein